MVMSKLLSLLVLSDLIKLMKTRTRSHSHIKGYRKGGSSWFRVSFQLLGHQVRKQGFHSFEAAEEYYTSVRREIRAGTYQSTHAHEMRDATVDELYVRFCASRGAQRSARTIEIGARNWRLHVGPVLGGLRVREVGRRELSRLVTGLRKKGLSDNSILTIKAELQNVLKMACEYELISHLPVFPKLVARPGMKNRFSPSEIARVIGQVEDPQKQLMIKLQYRLALRVGELLGLTPGKFNLQEGWVLIDQQKVDSRGWEVGPTKNRISRRLPLSGDLIEELRDYVVARDPSSPLWISIQLCPVSRNAYRKMLSKAAQSANLGRRMTTHSLRASMLNFLVNKTNMSVHSVAYFGRHDASQLLARYSGADIADVFAAFRKAEGTNAALICDPLATK